MGQILVQDELKEGMFITIHTGKIKEKERMGREGPSIKFEEDCSFKGSVLRIISIDLPYLAVEYFLYDKYTTTSIDTRDVKLMKLSKDYVKKIEPKFKVSEFLKSKEQCDWTFDQEVENKENK